MPMSALIYLMIFNTRTSHKPTYHLFPVLIDLCSGAGIHLEKGYGDVRPLRPPFHALSAVP